MQPEPTGLMPVQASTVAPLIDHLYYYLVGISVVFSTGIFLAVAVLAIRYRETNARPDRTNPAHDNDRLEIVWMVVPLLIAMSIFGWGATLYYRNARPPARAIQLYGLGKQWMWKFQHPEGKSEINELHVPVGYPVKIVLTSEDVIHSFFVPAFRVKMDVLPGRYTQVWFEATRPGVYHLFCAEYCGTNHSAMGGSVVALTPNDYEVWLAGGGPQAPPQELGAQVFNALGCQSCHVEGPAGERPRCPPLSGLFGRDVKLADGRTLLADEGYLRDAILEPRKHLVAGYEPLMPTYKGQLDEDGVLQLIAYIRSLGAATGASAPEGTR